MKASDARRRWARWRDRLRDRPKADFGYRIVVGVVGLVVLAVGILAIPYPGPGWAIVFVGLAILATEFDWARTAAGLRQRALRQGDGLGSRRQGSGCRSLGAAVHRGRSCVGDPVAARRAGWTAGLVGIEQPWLNSPIGLGD